MNAFMSSKRLLYYTETGNYLLMFIVEIPPKLKSKKNLIKISVMIGCLQTRVCKQPIIALYFDFENEHKFDNLEAR